MFVSEKSHQNLSKYIQFSHKKRFELIKKGIISSKTSYICAHSGFRLANMNDLYCNFCIYVSFNAANIFT